MLCASAGSAAAQTGARSVVDAFFSPAGIPEKGNVYTGEMLKSQNQKTLGEYFGTSATVSIRELAATADTARFGAEVRSRGATQDWYLFLARVDGRWKLSAVRTLAQTGVLHRGLEGLRGMRQRTAEQEWNLRNLELVLSSDAELTKHFLANRAGFAALASRVLGDRRADGKALHLQSAERAGAGYVVFTFGGVTDNTVGYLFVPEGVAVPAVTPEAFIHVERIGDGWYLFRTT
ncbi:MAG: hypothetical protein JNM66_16700 [Bryobacterales bacterium]|nr:hypothetical protein [Bryobacterales bacterium]